MQQPAAVWTTLEALRRAAPLVHSITNYVAMDVTANALLAVGASPAMVHADEEVEEFAGLADALVINIGTLSAPWVRSMRLAAARARADATPWVLDPVGAGATRFRTATAAALAELGPAVIRGNASEILALAGAQHGETRGVDSAHAPELAADAARQLARRLGCVVALTGATDHVTDGERTLLVENGHPLMTRVTALGCTATALVAACCAVEPDPLTAAAHALAVLGLCGENAARAADGPATLRLRLIDGLYALDEAALQGARIRSAGG